MPGRKEDFTPPEILITQGRVKPLAKGLLNLAKTVGGFAERALVRKTAGDVKEVKDKTLQGLDPRIAASEIMDGSRNGNPLNPFLSQMIDARGVGQLIRQAKNNGLDTNQVEDRLRTLVKSAKGLGDAPILLAAAAVSGMARNHGELNQRVSDWVNNPASSVDGIPLWEKEGIGAYVAEDINANPNLSDQMQVPTWQQIPADHDWTIQASETGGLLSEPQAVIKIDEYRFRKLSGGVGASVRVPLPQKLGIVAGLGVPSGNNTYGRRSNSDLVMRNLSCVVVQDGFEPAKHGPNKFKRVQYGLRINALDLPDDAQVSALETDTYRSGRLVGLLPSQVMQLVRPSGLLEIAAIRARRKAASLCNNPRDIEPGPALTAANWVVERLKQTMLLTRQIGTKREESKVNVLDSYTREYNQVIGEGQDLDPEQVGYALLLQVLALMLEPNYDHAILREETEIARLVSMAAVENIPREDKGIFVGNSPIRVKMETLKQKRSPVGINAELELGFD